MKKLIVEMPDEATMVALATVAIEPDGTTVKLMVNSHVVNLADDTTEIDLKNVWEKYKND